jgi:hypothetical protein
MTLPSALDFNVKPVAFSIVFLSIDDMKTWNKIDANNAFIIPLEHQLNIGGNSIK